MRMKITPTSVCVYEPKERKEKPNSSKQKLDDTKFTDDWKQANDDAKYGKQNKFDLQECDYDLPTEVKKEKQLRMRSMSSRSKRKIRNRMTYWYWLLKRKSHKPVVTFWTLTLTSKQIHTDKEMNVLLNTFLTRLRKLKKFEYLWISEIQTKKTGNLHFHIVFNVPFEIGTINYYWCKILQNNGYDVKPPLPYLGVVDGIKCYIDKPVFGCSFDSKNRSNPVDVERVFNIKGISMYMSKYVTKNDSKIGADMHHCSRMFSGLQTDITCDFDNDLLTEILTRNHYTNKDGKVISMTPVTIYIDKEQRIPIGTFLSVICTDYMESYYEQLAKLN